MGKKNKNKNGKTGNNNANLNANPNPEYVCIVTRNQDDGREENNYIPGNSPVKVLIANKKFAEKPAYEVRKGDIVLSKKKFLDVSISDLEWLMEDDPRYYSAQHGLYMKNSHGENIPLFRYHLIKGCAIRDEDSAQKGVISPDNLEKRIMKECRQDEQITAHEIDLMADYIHKTLIENYTGPKEHIVTRQTIKNWLRGTGNVRPREGTKSKDTLFPMHWELFQALAKVNPFFGSFYNDYMRSKEAGRKEGIDLSNIYDLYRFYVYTRTQTAREFSLEARRVLKEKLHDIDKTESDMKEQMRSARQRGETIYDITPIFRAIWAYYDKQETQYIFQEVARRVDVKKDEFDQGKKQEEGRKANGEKKAHIALDNTNVSGLHVLSRREHFLHHYFFLDVMQCPFMLYFQKDFKEAGIPEIVGVEFVTSAMMYSRGVKNPMYKRMMNRMEDENNPAREDQKRIFERSIAVSQQDIPNGVMDQYFNVEKGTMLKLYDIVYRLMDAMPRWYWNEVHMMNLAQERVAELQGNNSEMMKELGKLRKQTEEHYKRLGFMPDEFSRLVTSIYTMQVNPSRALPAAFPPHLIRNDNIPQAYQNSAFMGEVTRTLLGQGYTLIKKDEARGMLDFYGVGEAMKLIPSTNFIHSNNLINLR